MYSSRTIISNAYLHCMNYSTTYLGVIGMLALPLLINLGFSESCSNEITSILLPMLPGAFMVLRARFKRGDVSVLGVK